MKLRFVEMNRGSVALRDGDTPVPGRGQVRVRVRYCGVCGTDLHLLHGMELPKGLQYPLRPGHEVAGTVLEPGGASGGPAVGDLVVLHPVAPCGRCAACADGRDSYCERPTVLGISAPGGLAEEVVWPADRVVVVNDLIPSQAAVLADAVASAYHAVRAAFAQPTGSLCVLGAGGVGSHVLEISRVLYPQSRLVAVVSTLGSRNRLQALGYDVILGLDGAARRLHDQLGPVDAVVDFSGAAEAPKEALRMLASGGRLIFGSVLDGDLELGRATSLQARELTVTGAYSSTMADLRDVAAMVASGCLDLSGTVTHTERLTEIQEAFQLLERRPAGLVRMVIEVNE